MKKSAEIAKKKFLSELKESLAESDRASRGEIKLRPLEEAITEIEKKHGGKRVGAGRKPKDEKKLTRGVKLTEQEYNAIVKKYGSFAEGVKSLVPTNPMDL